MKYARIENGQCKWIGEREDIRIATQPRAELLTDEQLAAFGYYPAVLDATVPDGATVDAERWEVSGGVAYQTATAWRTAEEVAVAQAGYQRDRLLGLASIHNADLMELVRLLGVFGLSIPCTEADAEAEVYAQSKIAPDKTADGVKLMRVYGRLMKHITGDELVAIAQMLGVA